jgi:hypothetical protein
MNAENAKTLARAVAEERRKLAAGEYLAFPIAAAKPAPAKPATRQAPAMSEIERQSRANMAAKFALFDQINALCREFDEPDAGIACEMVERGLTVDEARRELAQRAAERGWGAALAGVRGPMN